MKKYMSYIISDGDKYYRELKQGDRVNQSFGIQLIG